ncbi:MAG TPA: aldehyde dehydrogenase family protein, partial [Pseudonocardiaceae bacterium]
MRTGRAGPESSPGQGVRLRARKSLIRRRYPSCVVPPRLNVCPAAISTTTQAGVGLVESNALGPLQNQMQWDVVNCLVEDARARGARIVLGGDPDSGAPGYFYPATLVADIDNSAPLVQEEQFGPVLPIIRYTDVAQAIEWANGVDVG